MDKELVAHIVELVKVELGNSVGAGAVHSATGMLRLELGVHQCLMEIGRQVVQDLAQEAGTGYQGRRVKRGRTLGRRLRTQPRLLPMHETVYPPLDRIESVWKGPRNPSRSTGEPPTMNDLLTNREISSLLLTVAPPSRC